MKQFKFFILNFVETMTPHSSSDQFFQARIFSLRSIFALLVFHFFHFFNWVVFLSFVLIFIGNLIQWLNYFEWKKEDEENGF